MRQSSQNEYIQITHTHTYKRHRKHNKHCYETQTREIQYIKNQKWFDGSNRHSINSEAELEVSQFHHATTKYANKHTPSFQHPSHEHAVSKKYNHLKIH